jgi:hypothetical protein
LTKLIALLHVPLLPAVWLTMNPMTVKKNKKFHKMLLGDFVNKQLSAFIIIFSSFFLFLPALTSTPHKVPSPTSKIISFNCIIHHAACTADTLMKGKNLGTATSKSTIRIPRSKSESLLMARQSR